MPELLGLSDRIAVMHEGRLQGILDRIDDAPEQHKPLFQKIIYSDIILWIENRQFEEIDRLLLDVLGPGYAVKELLKPAFSRNETKGAK